MKIKSLKILEDGMNERKAEDFWKKVEGFAAYSFNKSHSCTYAIISYWAMWMKVMYPAEFFAASMTVVDDDDKLASLVLDGRRLGLEILPPDINHSTDRIEIHGEKELYAPFQAVKGISGNVAAHILNVKKHWGKPFASKEEFEKALRDSGIGGKVNKAHKDRLERVGAFHSVTPGTLPPLHESRLKDRLELMPGITVDAVKADRGINNEKLAMIKVMRVIEDAKGCDKCSLAGTPHAIPRMGKTPKFMVVFDAPTWKEAQAGRMLEGDVAEYMKAVLKEVGLTPNDGYWTSLVKAQKPTGEKTLSTEAIVGCSAYLNQEIEILKPPIIVAMGGNAIRHFAPGTKGSPAELAGKVIFDKARDASIIFGFNPATLHFDPSKVTLLQTIAAKINDLVS